MEYPEGNEEVPSPTRRFLFLRSFLFVKVRFRNQAERVLFFVFVTCSEVKSPN